MREKTNHIVEKATALFMQHGLQSVSMDDIASFSGISKKTLYGNFRSKEMLVEMIVQKLILKMGKYLRLCRDISPNAVKELANFSGYMLDVLGVLTPKFTRDLKKYYRRIYTQLIVFKDNSVVPYLESCLDRGITEEIFRTGINKRNTGLLYCRQVQLVLEGNTSQADVKRIMETVNDLFLHGILNSKGLKLYGVDKQSENAMRKEKQEIG